MKIASIALVLTLAGLSACTNKDEPAATAPAAEKAAGTEAELKQEDLKVGE